MTSAATIDAREREPARASRDDAAAASDVATNDVAATTDADLLDWQRLWLATQRTPWATLALVPIGDGVPTARIATALAELGRQHLGGIIVACDATDVSLSTLKTELSALSERVRCAERAIVALPPLLESPAGLALARATDAVVLCISLGKSEIAEATQVLEDLGPRVLGTVIVRATKETP